MNGRHLNIHNWKTFNNQPQGKNISIAYNGDRFVEILFVQHFVKKKTFRNCFSLLFNSFCWIIQFCPSIFVWLSVCAFVYARLHINTLQGRQGRWAKSMLACIPWNASGCSTKSWYPTAFLILCIGTYKKEICHTK